MKADPLNRVQGRDFSGCAQALLPDDADFP